MSETGAETVLYNFSGPPDDGAYPYGGVILDAMGNVYGTTEEGGTYAQGTAFKVSKTGTEAVLYNFARYPDGAQPFDKLARGAAAIFTAPLP